MTHRFACAAALIALYVPATAQGLDPRIEVTVACAVTMNQDDATCRCLGDRAADMLSEDAQFFMAATMMRNTRLAQSYGDRVSPEDQFVIQRLLTEASNSCVTPRAGDS